MLRWRLISATAIILTLTFIFAADFFWNFGHPGIWSLPLLVGLAIAGAQELLRMYRAKGYHPSKWGVYTGVALTAAGGAAPLIMELVWKPYPDDCPVGRTGWIAIGFATGTGVALLSEIRRYQRPGNSSVNVALAVFAMAYSGALMAFMGNLRLLDGDNGLGMAALLSMVVAVKSGDIGAYATGRLIGRTKLTRRLSPGKTVEGAVGGVVVSAWAAWAFLWFATPAITGQANETPWWGAVIYGVTLAIAGLIGDLGESMLKRDLGVKDSSNWLPGLGGILDFMDSLLAAAPVAFLFWVAGIVGPL